MFEIKSTGLPICHYLQFSDSKRGAHTAVADVERSVVFVPVQCVSLFHGQRLASVRPDDEPLHCKDNIERGRLLIADHKQGKWTR